MKNTIQIPKMLHEIHGEISNVRDITITHLVAITSTAMVLVLGTEDLSILQQIVLGILTYDLVGGVVANFSYSTSVYYAKQPKKRKGFIALHLLQPTLLVFVFQNDIVTILSMSASILLSSILVNATQSAQRQIMLGAFFSIVGIMVLQLPFFEATPILEFLLVIFLLKLPLAWAVRWYDINSHSN